jgi:hypothetical protein
MIPADKILTKQYTQGNEFISTKTGKYYQGYYCIVADIKYYTGKTYTNQSKELFKSEMIPSPKGPTSLPPQSTPTRYFIRKTNISPITIKEVSENTYSNFINDPLYQITYVGPNQSIDQANNQLPGLKIWLLG